MGTRNRGQVEPATAFEELSLEGKTDKKTDHIQIERHVKKKMSRGAVGGKIKDPCYDWKVPQHFWKEVLPRMNYER